MKSIELENPFTPGTGKPPPYLAGRENVQKILMDNFHCLSNGKSPTAPTIIYGPRGMGKTALLAWFEDYAEQNKAENNPAFVKLMTPRGLKEPDDLWDKIVPQQPWIMKQLGRFKKGNAGGGALGVVGNIGLELSNSVKTEIEETLIKQYKERPLILLIDEAHNIDPDICYQLLDVHQLVDRKIPFMLVLAGTPALYNALSNLNVSFVERSKMIGLGRLDEKSAADAIVKPFEEQGIRITESALSTIVQESQCYPYFLQVWGKSLWTEANKENLTCITDEQVMVVKPDITIIKKDFYNKRRDKLKKLDLRSTAVAIAKVFQDTKEMSDDAIMEIIKDNLSVDSLNTQSAVEREQTFIDNDFIWRPQGSDFYEPGIPSFMTHMLNLQTVHIKTELERKSTSTVEREPIDNGKDSDGLGF